MCLLCCSQTIKNTFIFSYLADAFIQRNLQVRYKANAQELMEELAKRRDTVRFAMSHGTELN